MKTALHSFHCIFMSLLLGMCGIVAAQSDDTHIQANLMAESLRPASGQTMTLALEMVPAPGWHGYWRNPGDAGVETRVEWRLPAGMTAGEPSYPVPRRLSIAGLMNYVYEGPYALLIPLTIPPGIAPGTRLPIRADADWLACTDQICVPERKTLALDLVVGDGSVAPNDRARFDRWRAAVPKPLASQAHYVIEAGKLRIGIPLPAGMAATDPYFYPSKQSAVDYAATQTASRSGDLLILEMKAREGAKAVGPIDGVLALGAGEGLSLRTVPGSVPKANGAIDAGALLAALAAALLGGLVLNIMPCVFPILSLKALSLARAGGSERQVRSEAIAYAAGAVLMCVALGGLLLGLRSGGAALGWAFQLQDPRVILLLLLLVFAIALNLAGLFELPMLSGGGALASRGGAAGAFWTGALAAFVATPCTGPFMAAALGIALVLPWPAALAIFFGLGLGLALPFLLLGFVPALRARLPRPGPWMESFRRIISLPMFVTAIGLAWILGRQTGVDGMTIGLCAALLIAAGLWWIGRRQTAGRAGAWWPSLLAIPAIASAALLSGTGASGETRRAMAGSEPFSETRLAGLRAAHKPIFLYFTADWCLTCKVNERSSIDRAEVASAFAKAGVVTMIGDWTNGDAAIGRFLEAHGRSGVPFYLYYPAGGKPKELPQILTPGMLVDMVG